MTIKIIVSIHHTAAANAMLLPPLPPRCRRTSKCTAATAKVGQLVGRCRAAAAATSATRLPSPCYHCLKNKEGKLLINLFFTTMVMAARSNNSRNQSACIEKGKPKNNNKIRQHEKNKPIFQFPLFFFLVQPLFCSNSHHCNCHCSPSQRPPAMHAASPLPPPSSPQRRQQQRQFSRYRKHLAVAACKSFPPAYAH